MKVTTISSKDAQELLARYPLDLTKKDIIQRRVGGERDVIMLNKVPAFFFDGEMPIPTLRFVMAQAAGGAPVALLKKITVDMGAVRFVVNGADVMRPGIVAVEDGIAAGDPVVVVDQTHGKPLAVGKALCDSAEMLAAKTGKMIKTLHYVGDELWKEEA